MRWGWLVLTIVFVLIVQTAVAGLAGLPWLNLMFAMALVIGLVAAAPDARLAGWLVGFAADLQSAGPIGLNAFAFGLAVAGLTYVRELVIRHHWWARWLIGLVVAFPVQLILQTYLNAGHGVFFWRTLGEALATSLFASLLAAVMVGLPSLTGKRDGKRGHSTY
jgi:hypothetical protein